MVLRNSCAKNLVEPVCISRIAIISADIVSKFLIGSSPFSSIHQVWLVGNFVHSNVAIIRNLSIGTRTSLSGYEDHSASSSRSINSSRRRILQDGDGCNVVRRDSRHVPSRNSVYHDHRTLIVLKRGSTAEANLSSTSHVTRTSRYLEACYLALKQVGSIPSNAFIEIFLGNICYGTSDLSTRLSTITYCHSLS